MGKTWLDGGTFHTLHFVKFHTVGSNHYRKLLILSGFRHWWFRIKTMLWGSIPFHASWGGMKYKKFLILLFPEVCLSFLTVILIFLRVTWKHIFHLHIRNSNRIYALVSLYSAHYDTKLFCRMHFRATFVHTFLFVLSEYYLRPCEQDVHVNFSETFYIQLYLLFFSSFLFMFSIEYYIFHSKKAC